MGDHSVGYQIEGADLCFLKLALVLTLVVKDRSIRKWLPFLEATPPQIKFIETQNPECQLRENGKVFHSNIIIQNLSSLKRGDTGFAWFSLLYINNNLSFYKKLLVARPFNDILCYWYYSLHSRFLSTWTWRAKARLCKTIYGVEIRTYAIWE